MVKSLRTMMVLSDRGWFQTGATQAWGFSCRGPSRAWGPTNHPPTSLKVMILHARYGKDSPSTKLKYGQLSLTTGSAMFVIIFIFLFIFFGGGGSEPTGTIGGLSITWWHPKRWVLWGCPTGYAHLVWLTILFLYLGSLFWIKITSCTVMGHGTAPKG